MNEVAAGINPEELGELMEAVSGLEVGGDGLSVSGFLGSFLTESQLDAVDRVKSDALVREDSKLRLWNRISLGILRHPAVVGKIAALADVALEEVGEPAWKNEGACQENTDFVQSGSKSRQRILDLIEICQDCPVLKECHRNVKAQTPRYGFWAGATRGDDKIGYHPDGRPVTLRQNRQAIKKKMKKTRRAKS